MITQGIDYLSTKFKIDTENGVVYWASRPKNNRVFVGQEAGLAKEQHNGKKYWVITLDGRKIKRSQLIYLFVHGFQCEQLIDHINGDSLDDRSANLRSATITQNAWNHKCRARKINLPMGVRNNSSGKYQARITVNKKVIYLGAYNTPEEADLIYQQKRKEYYGEYA